MYYYTPFTQDTISFRTLSVITFLSKILNFPTTCDFGFIHNPVVMRSICIFPYLSSVWWCRNIQLTILSTPCSWSSIRTFRLLFPQRIESTIKYSRRSFSIASSTISIVFCNSSLNFHWNITVERMGLSADSFDFKAYLSELAIIFHG